MRAQAKGSAISHGAWGRQAMELQGTGHTSQLQTLSLPEVQKDPATAMTLEHTMPRARHRGSMLLSLVADVSTGKSTARLASALGGRRAERPPPTPTHLYTGLCVHRTRASHRAWESQLHNRSTSPTLQGTPAPHSCAWASGTLVLP